MMMMMVRQTKIHYSSAKIHMELKKIEREMEKVTHFNRNIV